jgi:hypothetical protein
MRRWIDRAREGDYSRVSLLPLYFFIPPFSITTPSLLLLLLSAFSLPFLPSPLTAGFAVWVGSPVVEASTIEFGRQLGSVIYVGAGALVLYGTPLVEFYGPFDTRTTEFWVMVRAGKEGGRE